MLKTLTYSISKKMYLDKIFTYMNSQSKIVNYKKKHHQKNNKNIICFWVIKIYVRNKILFLMNHNIKLKRKY